MRHHFADLLDRRGDYWTIVANRERYTYRLENMSEEDLAYAKVVTISKHTSNWEKILTLPNLEELTLHEPSKEQINGIEHLQNIRRLRITHIRLHDIEFIKKLSNTEELILEYVSGFSDLSPLRALTKLRALHLENLRKVEDFGGLSGIASLRYLRIEGTADWKQPVANFEFVKGLQNLEVFSLGWIKTLASFPALLPVTELKKLKRINLHNEIFPTAEYALLAVGLPEVEGASSAPFRALSYTSIPLPKDDPRSMLSDEEIKAKHPEVSIIYNGEREINDPNAEWFYFLGQKAGRIKCTSPSAKQKCNDFIAKYNAMKEDAKGIIERHRNNR